MWLSIIYILTIKKLELLQHFGKQGTAYILTLPPTPFKQKTQGLGARILEICIYIYHDFSSQQVKMN